MMKESLSYSALNTTNCHNKRCRDITYDALCPGLYSLLVLLEVLLVLEVGCLSGGGGESDGAPLLMLLADIQIEDENL